MSNNLSNSFQALHSPRGANAGFAAGMAGKRGGFCLENDYIVTQDIFIGVHKDGEIKCLPFYERAKNDAEEAYVLRGDPTKSLEVVSFPNNEIKRTYGWGTDTWEAGSLKFSLASPVSGIPDPENTPYQLLRDAVTPAIPARLVIDNSNGNSAIQGFFAVGGMRGIRLLENETNGEITGIATLGGYGFAVANAKEKGAEIIADFDLYKVFSRPEPIAFCLTPMGGVLVDVPAGETITLDIVLGWYKEGVVTAGEHKCSYYYTRYFTGITEVLRYSLTRIDAWWGEAYDYDARLENSGLNSDQQFIIAHSTRSYYCSSMLFNEGGKPRWVVNEGSFMMMNTFDLTVDHVFFELMFHPWAVRDQLDKYADEYSYFDELHFPGKSEEALPGGISFTHDQGVFNTFSPKGYSSYEIKDQEGCFSYMTQEQLTNWLLCSALYVHTTKDIEWLRKRLSIIVECLDSMLNRDHPDPEMRDGIMDLDSNRCGVSSEITTYDSLDPSLGQARRNLYLAGKCWAAYLGIVRMLELAGSEHYKELINAAKKAALRCANTITGYYSESLGYIPAILDGRDSSPIIPAVEGLVYPVYFGMKEAASVDGPYGEMVNVLKMHSKNIIRPGMCQFEDLGWKLSANSDNSWMSKIFLCQHIVYDILGVDYGDEKVLHDKAHADWWRIGCAENPAVDQVFDGKVAMRGFYYPRGVTSILWLYNK